MLAVLVVMATVGSAGAAPLVRHSRIVPAVVHEVRIEGTVTSASTHAAIDGIEVCAYLPEAEPICTFTNAAGKYQLEGPTGEYIVEFFSPFGSGLNFVTIYQGGATTWEEAEEHPLKLTSPGSDPNVNAEMLEGGHMTGHVTSTLQPGGIEGVEVCTLEVSGGEGFGCGLTNASGGYEISALPTGEYIVHFEPPATGPSYIAQLRKGRVSVTAGSTTAGVDAVLALGGEIGGEITQPPSGAPLPGAEACALISETEAMTCALTDSKGDYSLRGLPPRSYAVGLSAPKFQWQFYPSGRVFANAQQISIQEGTAVGLQTVELLPIGYKPPPPVIPTPIIPPPVPQPPPTATPQPPAQSGVAGTTAHSPAITLSSHLEAGHGRVSVKVACAGAPCAGTLRITMRVAYRPHRHVTLFRTVVLAQGAFSIAAGSRATLSLRETAAGRTHLARAGRHPLAAELLGSVSGGAPLSIRVRVT